MPERTFFLFLLHFGNNPFSEESLGSSLSANQADITKVGIARFLLVFLISGVLAAFSLFPAETHADKIEKAPATTVIMDELRDGFDWRFKVVGYGLYQRPANSLINYNNRLNIKRYEGHLDFRPDISFNFRKLAIDLKPRLNLSWSWWKEGKKDGEDDFDYTVAINYWLVRYMFTPSLFASYGREDLQWGPSYLISPSNPFRKDFKPDTPWLETPAMDYGKIIWAPNSSWSVSIISNIDKGRSKIGEPRPDDIGDFERRYAIKADFTGHQVFLSVIPSLGEYDHWEMGFYGGWNTTDATLIYGEGNVADDDFDFLIGGSFTMEMGPIIALEYYRNQNGCTDPLHECLLDAAVLENNELLKRENYILVQFVDRHIWDQVNIILRWVIGLDDHSDFTSATFEYEIGDHAKIFTRGDFYHGAGDGEFGSILEYSLTGGLEYSF